MRRFNLYFLLLPAAALLAGCATVGGEGNLSAVFRVYLESSANLPGTGKSVQVLRDQPVLVTVSPAPVITENAIIAARLIEVPGGCAIELKFDDTHTWLYEQHTSANSGRHLAIYAAWGRKLESNRWLAAPVISRRVTDGTMSFTPDATREEAQMIVTGLNNFAKKNKNR